MDPKIDDRIAMIGGSSQTLLKPATKEVIAEAARGSAWVNQTPMHVSRTGRDHSNPGETIMSVRYKPATSQL